jgi:anti-sigma B factor antagonist
MKGSLMENIRISSRVRETEGVPVIDVSGEVDIYTTPQFKEAVNEALTQGHLHIIINLTEVAYMDSSGFGTLLSATKRLRPQNGGIYLVGCNEAVSRMLEITRLNTIFTVVDTEDAAISAIASNLMSQARTPVLA